MKELFDKGWGGIYWIGTRPVFLPLAFILCFPFQDASSDYALGSHYEGYESMLISPSFLSLSLCCLFHPAEYHLFLVILTIFDDIIN